MTDVLIEACVTSSAQALAAEDEGAGRIELCGQGDGGITPAREVLLDTLSLVRVPVHVMIRPREGNFVYSAAEIDQMRLSIEMAKRAGAAGVVFGVLHNDGVLQAARMRELVELARPLRVACHRAFDRTPNPESALAALMQFGVDFVLTSGHAPTALEGVETLARHVQQAGDRLTVLAGGSVRAENVREIIARSGVSEVHARATSPGVIAALAAQTAQMA